jgi:hypothetical protein
MYALACLYSENIFAACHQVILHILIPLLQCRRNSALMTCDDKQSESKASYANEYLNVSFRMASNP